MRDESKGPPDRQSPGLPVPLGSWLLFVGLVLFAVAAAKPLFDAPVDRCRKCGAAMRSEPYEVELGSGDLETFYRIECSGCGDVRALQPGWYR